MTRPALARSVVAAAIGWLAIVTSVEAKAGLVILVRHAEKAAESGDPELTAGGRDRAEALARALADAPLDAIITSQFRRTVLTAAPAAKLKGVAPQVIEAGKDVAAHAAAVAAAIDRLPDGASALVVGHSNTLGPIIAALGGPRVADLCDGEYATMLLLERGASSGPRLVRARYGAADPPGADQCQPK